MANMNRLQTRIQKKDEKHQKTLELIAKLQAQAAEEEKQLQDDKMQLNSAWVKRLDAAAEKKSISIHEINIERLVELIEENRTRLLSKKEEDAEVPKQENHQEQVPANGMQKGA